MNTSQEQQKGDPKSTQPKQADQGTGHMSPEHSEEIMNRARGAGIVYRRVIRAKRQKTDQGKNDEEKKKYANDLFAHALLFGCWLLATILSLLAYRRWMDWVSVFRFQVSASDIAEYQFDQFWHLNTET
jgi:hypothetical protein